MRLLYSLFSLSKNIATSYFTKNRFNPLNKTNVLNSEEKEYIINQLTSKDFFEKRFNDLKEIDSENDWKKIKQVIKSKKIKFKYIAVAAISLVFITMTFQLIQKKYFELTTDQLTFNDIHVGTDKAFLTLDNGENIYIDNKNPLNFENINSNGKSIVYDKNYKDKKLKYHYLTVPKGGQFSLTLTDNTIIWLNSDTKIKYPSNINFNEYREIELIYGEAYFNVTSSKINNDKKFRVLHKNQEVIVHGTEFNIKAYKDESKIYTTLVEGIVSVKYDNNFKKLKPKQQSIFDIESNLIVIEYIDVFNEISWKDGKFSFENKSLKEIMSVLSRWYNVDIKIINKSIENEEFIGVISKDQDIESTLSIIKSFGTIKEYKIEKNKILIY